MIKAFLRWLFNKREPAQPEPVRIQLLITKCMRRQLNDLGYTKYEVDAMTPGQAQQIILDHTHP